METLSIGQYFSRLANAFGKGWTRFWYLPSDPFPLCLMRILVGIFSLCFILSYTEDLSYFFAQGGLLSLELTEQYPPFNATYNPAVFSYFSYLHSPLELHIAHWIGIVILCLFTIGWHSRITAVLGLFVILSYIHRAPLITSEIEPLLAAIQFYLCFGPCGARLSVDRYLAKRKMPIMPQSEQDRGGKFFSATLSTRLIQIHLCIIAAMMGIAKLSGPGELTGGGEWVDPWGVGEAVWWMIARPQTRIFEGLTSLRDYPYLIAAWTHIILLVELVFPILIWNRLVRPLVLAIAFVAWGSLILISGIGPFYALLIIGCISFFHPQFTEFWTSKLMRTKSLEQLDPATSVQG